MWPRSFARKWRRAPSRRCCIASLLSRALAETGLELGLYISLSGVLTFKGSNELRAIARDVPLDRLLVETDAPFLAPVPHRGQRNEPAFVVDTARVLAEVKGLDFASLAAATRANTLRSVLEDRGQGVTLALTILGCGSSGGVPRVAQGWGACDPNNPRNARRRCSVLVERTGPAGKTVVLIDTSPDLRLQLIDAGRASSRRRPADPCPRRPLPWHRRPAPARHRIPKAHRHAHGCADLVWRSRQIFLHFQDAAGQFLSAYPRREATPERDALS